MSTRAIRDLSPFAVDRNELEVVFGDAGRFVAREYDSPTPRPIIPSIPQDLFDEVIGLSLPDAGTTLAELNLRMQDFLAHHTVRMLPPGFSAMVTTSPNPYALLADMLACGFNQHMARSDVTEFGSRLEQRVLLWVGDFMNYPAVSGNVTSGGASANLLALAAARVFTLDPDVRRKGMAGARLVAYASTETHITTVRPLELLGIGSDNLRQIPVDARFRMNVGALQECIREDRWKGYTPFAVVAQGGSTATGAVDDLNAIADVCEVEGVWMHVDAAYGGPAAGVEVEMFRGLERADSVTVDPHKWLYVNYDCGCLLSKHAHILEDTFSVRGASYLRSDAVTDAPEFMSRGVEMSRGLRALKLWSTFAGIGASKLRVAIAQDISHAQWLGRILAERDHFELCCAPSLSIVVFRFVPADGLSAEYLDRLNSAIPGGLREDGRIYLGSAVLDGRAVLRICLLNHRVTDRDILEWVEIIAQVGHSVHLRLQHEQRAE